jgi:hypothetical protein
MERAIIKLGARKTEKSGCFLNLISLDANEGFWMRKPFGKSSIVISFVALTVGCNPAGSLPKPALGYYGKETLGKLPEAPDSSDTSKVVSLVQASGDMPQYKMKVKTNIRAGKTMSCEIKAGEIVDAIAEKGSLMLIHAQRSSLARDCENSGEADFVEGYVEKAVLEQVPSSEADASSQIPVPQRSGDANPQSTAPSSSTTDGQPSSSSQQESAICKSVKYGSYVKKADQDENLLIAYARSAGRPNTIPGALWRSGGDNFLLMVKGKASKWKVQAFNTSKKSKMPAVVLDAQGLKKGDSGETEIPFKKFVKDPNEWIGASIEIKISALDAQGGEGSQECTQKVNLLSPLVLDFSGAKIVHTLPLTHSGVEFDLNGDGLAEQVGWVAGDKAAFLTIDLNHNGIVDSGRELFGDATSLKNKNKASDGFKALAQYDSNSDGRIDALDPAYSKLKLWFDRNGNGRSESNELVSLKAQKVKWISVRGDTLPRTEALQHTDSLVPNDVRLSAQFSAEGCPKGLCKVYDIFFGAVTNQVVTQK